MSVIPTPMFAWMMTDSCGLVNTGWSHTGATMQQTNAGTSSWTPSYNISVGSHFGNAIRYPNAISYFSMSTFINQTIDMGKSLTLFAYFWLYSSTDRFCIIEFYQGVGLNNLGPHFWIDGGGFYLNFSKSMFYFSIKVLSIGHQCLNNEI